MKETFAIAVIQTTAVVPARQQQQQQQTLPVCLFSRTHEDDGSDCHHLFVQVLNVLVETDTHILSLIRYIPDLIEFDQMVRKFCATQDVTQFFTCQCFVSDQKTLSKGQDTFPITFSDGHSKSRKTTQLSSVSDFTLTTNASQIELGKD